MSQRKNYIEKLNELRGSERLEMFLDLCGNTEDVQRGVLLDILARNANCEFCTRHNSSSVKSGNDFKNRFPITHWKDLSELSERMQHGESNLLFDGVPENFIITSGTTGAEKLLPESVMGNSAKRLTGSLRDFHLVHLYPELLDGKFLPLSNSPKVGYTSTGIPISSASGFTTASTAPELLKLNACPQAVKESEDLKAAEYAIMRFAVAADVRTITGNNAGRIPILLKLAEENAELIIDDIENGTLNEDVNISSEIRAKLIPDLIPNPERAAELRAALDAGARFLPSLYWPNLKVVRCWISGSVGRYIEDLKPMLAECSNEIVFFDGGYGASEGKFNIPLEAGCSSGPLTLFSAFYEFISAESDDDAILLAHQLEDGKEYRIIITTYSGLYRYDMKDIVRVDGFTGSTPNIRFISKTADIGNICGEKLSGPVLIKALNSAEKGLNLDIVHFGAVPDKGRKKYIFCIEIAGDGGIPDNEKKELSEEIDKYLMDNAVVYRHYRQQGLLNPPEVKEMKKGWRESLYAEKVKKGSSIAQIKLPVIYDTV